MVCGGAALLAMHWHPRTTHLRWPLASLLWLVDCFCSPCWLEISRWALFLLAHWFHFSHFYSSQTTAPTWIMACPILLHWPFTWTSLRYEWQGKWLFNNFQDVGSLGISSFNDCQERRVTITDPWFRVVDAKAAVASSVASAGLQVWTPEMGSNSWYRRRGYCARPAWGPSSGHKAPPLPWPCPPGNMTFLHSSLWYRITYFVEKWRKDSIVSLLANALCCLCRCHCSSRWMI